MIFDTKLPHGMSLQPCPFCGGHAQLIPDGENVIAGCINRDCLVLPITICFRTKRDAIRAWNQRGITDPLDPIIPIGGKLKVIDGTT
jgi:hypothetical protein